MADSSPEASTLAAFNAAAPEAAERDVLACCASGTFAKVIADGRPYRDPVALQRAVDAEFAALSWDDIVESMNAHPRIGDQTATADWSAAEQSGAAAASNEVRRDLAERKRRVRGTLRPRFPDLRQRPFRAGDAEPAPGEAKK